MTFQHLLKPIARRDGLAGAIWTTAVFLVASAIVTAASWFVVGPDGSGVVGPFVVAVKLFVGITLFRLLAERETGTRLLADEPSPEGMLR